MNIDLDEFKAIYYSRAAHRNRSVGMRRACGAEKVQTHGIDVALVYSVSKRRASCLADVIRRFLSLLSIASGTDAALDGLARRQLRIFHRMAVRAKNGQSQLQRFFMDGIQACMSL